MEEYGVEVGERRVLGWYYKAKESRGIQLVRGEKRDGKAVATVRGAG
jgi:hypothetical protein